MINLKGWSDQWNIFEIWQSGNKEIWLLHTLKTLLFGLFSLANTRYFLTNKSSNPHIPVWGSILYVRNSWGSQNGVETTTSSPRHLVLKRTGSIQDPSPSVFVFNTDFLDMFHGIFTISISISRCIIGMKPKEKKGSLQTSIASDILLTDLARVRPSW